MWVSFGVAALAFGIGTGSAGTIYLIKEKINQYTNTKPKKLTMLEDTFYSLCDDIYSKTYRQLYPLNEIEKNMKEIKLIEQANEELKKIEDKSFTRKKHFEKFSKELEMNLSKVHRELKRNLEINEKMKELGI